MPKVYLNENERLIERFVSWVYGEMKRQGVHQKDMAEELEITPSALCQKLKNRSLTFKDFLIMVRVLDPDAKELGYLLGRKEGSR